MHEDVKVAKIIRIVRTINQLFIDSMFNIFKYCNPSENKNTSSPFAPFLTIMKNNKNYEREREREIKTLLQNKPGKINMSLLFIYEYEKLNKLGKTIISEAGGGVKKWYRDYSIEDFKNKEIKNKAFFDFIDECSNFNLKDRYISDWEVFDANKAAPTHNREIYIFWALLILAVDKTDAEKNLKSICDFADIFGFSNEKLEYIAYVVKVVCEGHLSEFKSRTDEKYKNEDNLEIFDDILEKFGNYHFTEINEKEISEDIL